MQLPDDQNEEGRRGQKGLNTGGKMQEFRLKEKTVWSEFLWGVWFSRVSPSKQKHTLGNIVSKWWLYCKITAGSLNQTTWNVIIYSSNENNPWCDHSSIFQWFTALASHTSSSISSSRRFQVALWQALAWVWQVQLASTISFLRAALPPQCSTLQLLITDIIFISYWY